MMSMKSKSLPCLALIFVIILFVLQFLFPIHEIFINHFSPPLTRYSTRVPYVAPTTYVLS
jgi:hypothetical protein